MLLKETNTRVKLRNSIFLGYKVSNSNITSAGIEIDLVRKESKEKISNSEENVLKCIISYETDSRLRVKIFNPNEDHRYEVSILYRVQGDTY